MGLYPSSRRSCCINSSHEPVPPPMPDPSKFTIFRSHHVCLTECAFVLVEIVYEGCTNFEGRKILLYRVKHPDDVLKATRLDPHFCDNPNCISPIARFVPTEEGWQLGKMTIWFKAAKTIAANPEAITNLTQSQCVPDSPIPAEPVYISYQNWKGEIGLQHILPKGLEFTQTQWHKKPQWVLHAFDLQKQEERSFACADILNWYGQHKPDTEV